MEETRREVTRELGCQPGVAGGGGCRPHTRGAPVTRRRDTPVPGSETGQPGASESRQLASWPSLGTPPLRTW